MIELNNPSKATTPPQLDLGNCAYMYVLCPSTYLPAVNREPDGYGRGGNDLNYCVQNLRVGGKCTCAFSRRGDETFLDSRWCADYFSSGARGGGLSRVGYVRSAGAPVVVLPPLPRMPSNTRFPAES